MAKDFGKNLLSRTPTRNLTGPAQGVGMSVSFVGFKFVYGLLEHAHSFVLHATAGQKSYRIYMPYIIAHNPKQYASVLWLNATETWIDIDSSTADKGVLASLVDKFRSSQEVSQIDAHFIIMMIGSIEIFTIFTAFISIPQRIAVNMYSVAGIPHVGADVGGFFKNVDEQLLARWYQAPAFQPFFRAHAHIDCKRREPYLFSERTKNVIRYAIRTRYSFLPYWYDARMAVNLAGMAPPTEPFTPNFYAGDLICDGWTVEGEIGRGGCGVVYQVSAKVTEQLNGVMTERIIHAAMKCEGVDHDGRYSETLHSEVTVLRRMQRSEHVCRLYRAGRFSASVNVVIMSLVGRSLSFMRRLCKDRCFSTSTAIRVAFQCLEAIQELHFIGYIHRDIKPCNFAIGLYPDDVRRVVLLDFGFSRQYLKKGYDGQMRHRYPRSRAPFLGTPRYCSMNSADGKEQGRCDDLWSWMFMLVEFIEGKLPWKNCATPVELNREKRQALDTLLDGCPHQLYRIFDHIQTLKYADRPDYNMMFSTLRIIWEVEQVSQEDLVLDWEAGGRCHKRYLQAEMSRPQMKKLKTAPIPVTTRFRRRQTNRVRRLVRLRLPDRVHGAVCRVSSAIYFRSRIPRIMKKSPRGEACRPAVIQEKPKWRWCHMVTGTPKYANLSVRKNYSNVVNENCGRQHTDKIVASDLIIANVQTDQNVSETSCLELIANDDEATGLFDVICDGRKRCHESMLNMLIHLFSTLLQAKSLPYIIAHNPKQYASVLWLNATETWTDIDSSTADKGVLASLVDKFRSSQEVSQIDAHFMTESGMIDVFIFLGPTPNDVFRQYSTLIGVYSLQEIFTIFTAFISIPQRIATAITKSTFWRTVRRCVYVYCGIEVIGTHAGEVYCTGVSMHPTILHGGLGIAERPFSTEDFVDSKKWVSISREHSKNVTHSKSNSELLSWLDLEARVRIRRKAGNLQQSMRSLSRMLVL
ncbi:hypothetical protein QR680_002906 [Steinernema hermaphroditum]|uniref:Protein kinase domain-containing protein n=1 Tax=Steinernema hermaphroditum TaxID=289476 RepID=A0AA39H6E3_9BILA|nr:hypothetical protein QR680_002906 [Steinernema hermaphroditum]